MWFEVSRKLDYEKEVADVRSLTLASDLGFRENLFPTFPSGNVKERI